MTVRRTSLLASAAMLLCAGLWSSHPAVAQTATAPAPAAPAPAAPAPAVTAEGAQALAAALKAGLGQWLGAAEQDGSVRFQGDPLVMPAGDRYTVALPAFTLSPGDGETVDVPSIRLEVTPLADRAYGVTATLPTTVSARGTEGVTGTLSLGRQQFKGVWSSAYESFLKVDASYGDIKVQIPGGEEGLSVHSLTLTEDLTGNGGSVFSGPSALMVQGLDATDEDGDVVLHLGTLAIETMYTRFDLARLQRLSALGEEAARTKTEPPASKVVELLQGLIGGATFKLTAKEASVYDSESDTTVQLDGFTIDSGADGLDKPLATASFGVQARGIGIEPAPGPSDFTPRTMALQISFANVPSEGLIRLFAAQPAAPAPGQPPEDLFATALETLIKAGAELRIDTLEVATPTLGASMAGAARLAADAVFGGVGTLNASVQGIDTAVKALQPKPGQPQDPDAQGALSALTMLQAMGQQAKDAQGKEVRRYELVLSPAGQILLNGADMSAMLGLPAPAAAKP